MHGYLLRLHCACVCLINALRPPQSWFWRFICAFSSCCLNNDHFLFNWIALIYHQKQENPSLSHLFILTIVIIVMLLLVNFIWGWVSVLCWAFWCHWNEERMILCYDNIFPSFVIFFGLLFQEPQRGGESLLTLQKSGYPLNTGELIYRLISIFLAQTYKQCLSQDLETGCLKLAVVKSLGVQIFKGYHNILIFQP